MQRRQVLFISLGVEDEEVEEAIFNSELNITVDDKYKHWCVCPCQGMDSQRHIFWPCLYSVSSVKIVRFVDISEIYDHHFLNFLFIIVYYK